MKCRINVQLAGKALAALGLWMFPFTACFAQTAPDEKGLWAIWQSQTNKPDDHLAIIDACKEFRTKSPKDPLVTVTQGLEAWHLLKLGKTNEAVKILEPMVTQSEVTVLKAGSDMACSWLTRIDREQVVAALKKVYNNEIEYPVTLLAVKSLKGRTPPPLLDRWGQSWVYQVKERARIPRQGFELQSKRIGEDSDLTKALKVPYADRISLTPVRIMSSSADKVFIEFMLPTQKTVLLQAGTASDGVVVAYVGAKIIVLSDGSHWRVVVKPR